MKPSQAEVGNLQNTRVVSFLKPEDVFGFDIAMSSKFLFPLLDLEFRVLVAHDAS